MFSKSRNPPGVNNRLPILNDAWLDAFELELQYGKNRANGLHDVSLYDQRRLNMAKVCFHGLHDLINVPRKYELHHRHAKALHLFGTNMGRERERVRVGDSIDQHRTGMVERLLNY